MILAAIKQGVYDFFKPLRDFRSIYRLYRKAHSRRYSAKIAFGCAFLGLPF